MHQLSLHELGTRGTQVLDSMPKSEPILVAGQDGPVYFLVPIIGDIAQQQHDLQIALAKASFRENSRPVEQRGIAEITDDEMNAEIRRARADRRHIKAG
jgi:antitoxin (DNA-binding transcriptional repressor) of toxin-antitoxin stability system